jgi:SAM-dependent methyltransferase
VRVLSRNLARVRRVAARRGWVAVLLECARWVVRYLLGLVGLRGRGSFTWDGRSYQLFRHGYHYTWMNERAVEVPIFRALLAGHDPARVLEVGNVLSHYGPLNHAVVDRYERAEGVVNRDVMEIGPPGPLDLIVSISTLEHVGWDEEPRDPDKAARAIEHLRGLLAPGGRLVFSVPAGYNPGLDRRLAGGEVELSELGALGRDRGGWREVDPRAALAAGYDELLYEAEAVLIATAQAQPPNRAERHVPGRFV